MRLGYIFFSETFHQHLEEEGTLGETGMRWTKLIRHLENREFDFTYAKLEGELEKLKQGDRESPRDFARKFKSLLKEVRRRAPAN